jgi:hypothetical protein
VPRGIQNTLRARWLAAHGRGGVSARTARRPLARPLDLMPAPSIMAGVSERPARADSFSAPSRPAPQAETAATAPAPPPASAGVPNCAGELARIANYAAHVAEGVAPSPNDDLALFTPEGRPTSNLAKVMANMAAVEIGPARPRGALIAVAVAQLGRMLEEPTATLATPEAAPDAPAPQDPSPAP